MRGPRSSKWTVVAGFLALSVATGVSSPPASSPEGPDDRAVEIALRSLEAIERGWALQAHRRRARIALNLRGSGGFGATANLVTDPAGRRWRLDAAGDVGPLTLLVRGGRATLHVPALEQWGEQPASDLARFADPVGAIASEIAAIRERLRGGYAELVYRGESTVDGVPVHRIEDVAVPGTTVSFWIDARRWLPRRVVVHQSAGPDTRVELSYGQSPRPSRIVMVREAASALRIEATPAYDAEGRLRNLRAVIGASGSEVVANLNVVWSPRVGDDFFAFAPPRPTRRVAFEQLARGVVLSLAGRLGPLVRALMGAG